jgi:hypothetical protein
VEAARVDCVKRNIGAAKQLDPANEHPQLPGCPLTMKDKSRLAANIKPGVPSNDEGQVQTCASRRGEHV